MWGVVSGRAKGPGLGMILCFAALLATACSGNGSTQPNPEITPFVGDWTAQSLVLTSQANPDITFDAIQSGATFTFNVQPSGQYTAILLYAGQSLTAIGTMEVSGNTLTQHQTFPTASTSAGTFSFQGDHLLLDFNTTFDFNGDHVSEPAVAHADFVKK